MLMFVSSFRPEKVPYFGSVKVINSQEIKQTVVFDSITVIQQTMKMNTTSKRSFYVA